ncbi:immunity 42 family protein [Sphingomonas sp. LB-2]|uniref:immunity 42 family protein n=1 Tax=Sphingomonas caeni TaxID=2984949 RepID=UPI00222F9CE4|nr:immunity 42 family protein [Sphingomonas caeni]MCW3849387.1 immunity 42 family protein [Sphingomonas caeni]
MIVGDPESFAIESAITMAIADTSQRALGFFIVHIRGSVFGVRTPDASMLACSFDEVKRRLDGRGTHRMPNLSGIDAPLVAEAVLDAIYGNSGRSSYFGMTSSEFTDAIYGNRLIWAPDGDEAFDDGSHILQFDVEDRVRLLAFRNLDCRTDAINSLREAWIEGDAFYRVLADWSALFAEEWTGTLREANTTGPH